MLQNISFFRSHSEAKVAGWNMIFSETDLDIFQQSASSRSIIYIRKFDLTWPVREYIEKR